MAKVEFHPDFKDFLTYLNSQKVEYLLIGGYAAGYHGYTRATGDMVVWIAVDDYLKINKKASGRYKDLADLKHLP